MSLGEFLRALRSEAFRTPWANWQEIEHRSFSYDYVVAVEKGILPDPYLEDLCRLARYYAACIGLPPATVRESVCLLYEKEFLPAGVEP